MTVAAGPQEVPSEDNWEMLRFCHSVGSGVKWSGMLPLDICKINATRLQGKETTKEVTRLFCCFTTKQDVIKMIKSVEA